MASRTTTRTPANGDLERMDGDYAQPAPENRQVALLLAATVAMGLMAGVFGEWAHTIMRGLGDADDRTFVAAFQGIDRAIFNPLFMLAFMGALILTGIAGALCLRDRDHPALLWVGVAFGLYLAVVVITFTVHEPLNEAIRAAGDPARSANLAAVRAAFDEPRWVAWNVVRAAATTVAFESLAWALVLQGRATGNQRARAAMSAHEMTMHPPVARAGGGTRLPPPA
jgi:uncharacterized membrane protein